MHQLAVKTKNLKKSYGNFDAISGLDLNIDAGEFFGLLGPNGAGKTTSIHMMSSLIKPTNGYAKIFGLDVTQQPVEVRRNIGLVFQDSVLDRQLSVWENLRFAGLLHNLNFNTIKNRANYLLELFGIFHKKNSPVVSLSGGQRRVIDIARGVMHEPKILFLDEPTIGLDLPTRRNIWRHIHQLRAKTGMTVLLTTHYLEEAESCNRVAFLKNGNIVLNGNPRELVSQLACEIIEIETSEPERVAEITKDLLGVALIEFETLFFKLEKKNNFNSAEILSNLKKELGLKVKRVLVRQPNLNDVFLWVNSK
ncbi:MAG: hypothetical protein CBD16_03970 [Betaproteobacteria bacterium TMED156]|nr:MAG: hypothetical protein CBD16_03970 [Betaproteobacteria bacterium TMED156]